MRIGRQTPIKVANLNKIKPRWLRLSLWVMACFVFWFLAGVGVLYFVYLLVKDDLPTLPELNQYNPPLTTRIYDQTGILVGEFAVERRDVVPSNMIPRKLVEAVIASEDDNFFNHGGIDPLGIFRAAVKNLKAGRIVQGGSTLTQQVAKSLIGREKTFTRKFKEAILARRLENKFTKEEILYLYLNQIYLGHGSYGVQAAAKNYFHKNVWELALPEMATLAGLPQAPSDYDPVLQPEAARERRSYVLSRMRELGVISEKEEQEANAAALAANPIVDLFRLGAPYFVEEVRRQLSQSFTADGLYEGGLTVETSLDLFWQNAADEVLLPGIKSLDHRLGFRGVLYHFDQEAKRRDFLAKLDQRLGEKQNLENGKSVLAVVDAVEEDLARISIGTSSQGVLPVFGMRWARKPDPIAYYANPSIRISDARKVLKAGDVILVRKVDPEILLEGEPPTLRKMLPPGVPVFALDQIPGVQGALVSGEPKLGYVRAIVGGYNFEDSEFNRILQACRQPGSAFKPIHYSLAIETKNFTPATLVLDTPVVYDDPENAKRYKPDNIDGQSKGMTTVHTALVNSLNRPSVHVLESIGSSLGESIGRTVAWAEKLGITTPLKPELGLALGSSCVKPWDLVHVFAVFNQGGLKPRMGFIRKVTDRFGRVLINNTSYLDPYQSWDEKFDRAYDRFRQPMPRVISADSNYIITHLLEMVASRGTAAQSRALGKPTAGKTGTTNDSTDAWFIGFTHDVITGIWFGHDSPTDPLGPYETGSRTAVPLWLKFMQRALMGRPQAEFDVPPGIRFARIDPATGLLARPDTPNSVLEAFKRGEEPKEFVPAKDVARPGQFFKVDK